MMPGGSGKPSSPADVPERSCHMTNRLPKIRMSGSGRGERGNHLACSTPRGTGYPTMAKAGGFEAAAPTDRTGRTRLGRPVRLVIVAARGYHGGVPMGISQPELKKV